MSRVLLSALALSVFGGSVLVTTPAQAQSLNINPFPMEKATTLSTQPPQMIEGNSVKTFAKEAEDEILRLELEKADLRRRLEEKNAEDVRAVGDQGANDVLKLKRQNEALARQLAAVSYGEPKVSNVAAAPERSRPPVSLKQKNRALAQELRQVQALERGNKADLGFAMQALEAQRKADNASAVSPVQPYNVASYQSPDADNVRMTPMPLMAGDKDLRVSGVDRIDPALVHAKAVAPRASVKPASGGAADLTKIKILPSPMQGSYAGQPIVTQAHRGVVSSVRAGEPLEDVLRGWSQAEGVGFLWKTTMRFDVPQAMSSKGRYEDSLAALLGQFDNAAVRPIGTLHVDPVTNFKTLTIMSE